MSRNAFLFILVTSIIITIISCAIIAMSRHSATYLAVKVPYGYFTETQALDVSYNNKKDIATAFVENPLPAYIKKGAVVILRDSELNALPLGGEISLVRTTSDGSDILINLPAETDTELLTDSVDIITFEARNVRLIPQSAIVLDENETPFIWTAQSNAQTDIIEGNEKYTVMQERINISYLNEMHAVPLRAMENDLIILNPNTNLSKEDEYPLVIRELDVPQHNPIYAAWLGYIDIKRSQLQLKLASNSEACRNGTPYEPEKGDGSIDESAPPPPSGSTSSNSCGAGTDGPISAEAIFANIKALSAGETQDSGACGQTTNSCGQ